MTAPTPDREWDLLLDNAERLGAKNPDSWEFSAHEINLVLTRLSAVTAERDQAVEALAATNKLGAFETGKTIGAAELRKERDQARQKLADAPHDRMCGSHPMNGVSDHGCSCWKAGL